MLFVSIKQAISVGIFAASLKKMFSTHLLHSLAVSLLWIFKTHRMRMAAWKQSKVLAVNRGSKNHVLNYPIKVSLLIALTDAFPGGLGH